MATEDPPSAEVETTGYDVEDSGEARLSPGQIVGSFRVMRPIGEGGMGTVYLAEHQQIGYRAAIKVLHREFSRHPEVARRFLNEARAVNIVQHPGIVKIFEFDALPDKTAYIIMEHLDGETLTRRLERSGGRMAAVSALRLGKQIASALAAAHRKNVVHRDLKPGNIMLVPDPAAEGKERVKLLDFGLAKVADGYRDSAPKRMTRTGVVLGTAMYMAPEQCRGARDVDGRADVYALGIVLYEALCGHPPFVADSEGELVTMQLRDEPPPLLKEESTVPEEMAALVHRMLAKAPHARPNMDQASAELEALAEQWAPSGRLQILGLEPPSTTEILPRPQGPQKRRRVAIAAIAAVLGLLCGAGGWLLIERNRPGVFADGATWTTVPSNTDSNLRAAFRAGDDGIWIVGDRGTILRGRGVRFTAVPSETTQGLRAVWGSGPNDVWAVGGQGTMLHWNGIAWGQQEGVTTANLRGLWGAGPKEVWAVGEQGTILHYDGARWARVPSGTNDDFRAIWGMPAARAGDSTTIWAVGEYGLILRWDGTAWSRSPSGTKSRLAKVWGLGQNDVFAVGNEGTILHWDGKAWSKQDSGIGEELSAIIGHSPTDLWVVGNEGTILKGDGNHWLRPRNPATERWLFGLCHGTAPGELWAVGGYGVILRHRGP